MIASPAPRPRSSARSATRSPRTTSSTVCGCGERSSRRSPRSCAHSDALPMLRRGLPRPVTIASRAPKPSGQRKRAKIRGAGRIVRKPRPKLLIGPRIVHPTDRTASQTHLTSIGPLKQISSTCVRLCHVGPTNLTRRSAASSTRYEHPTCGNRKSARRAHPRRRRTTH